MEQQILKHIIDNPNWIKVVSADLFQDSNNKLFGIAKQMQDKSIKPTLDSLRYICTQKDLLAEIETLNCIQQLKPIDESTFKILLEEGKKVAAQRLILQLGLIQNGLTHKEVNGYIKRINELHNNEEPVKVNRATSFYDWNSHISNPSDLLGSGFTFLENTGADFCKGNLVTNLAPSGHGKTQCLSHIAKHLFMCKKNVLYIAFEETEAQFKSRIGKGLLNLSSYQYKKLTPEQIELRFEPKLKQTGQLDVIVGTSIYVEDIQNSVKEQEDHNGYKYDAVIIDYSKQLELRSQTKNAREDQVVSTIFRLLKQWANTKDEEKLVVTAVQSNRGGYGVGRSVGAENMADSMGPMHNSDFVWSIKRKDMPNNNIISEEQVNPNDINTVLKFTIVKKREGTIQQGSWFYYNLNNAGNIRMVTDQERRVLDDPNTGFESLLDPLN